MGGVPRGDVVGALSKRIGEFEVTPERLRWLSVSSHDQEDHAKLLDVISAIERRELEELGANTLRLAVTAA